MFHFTKKRAVVLAVVGSLAVSAGAYAYFTSTGSGTDSATVGTTGPWRVGTAYTSGDALTPGGAAQTKTYTVANGGPATQHLTKLAVSVANEDGSTWVAAPGCSKGDFIIGDAAAGATYDDTENAGDISPGYTTYNRVTIQMANRDVNQNGCKNTTPPLYLAAS